MLFATLEILSAIAANLMNKPLGVGNAIITTTDNSCWQKIHQILTPTPFNTNTNTNQVTFIDITSVN